MSKVAAKPSVAVAPLIEMLGDDQWAIRRDAADALGDIGPDARSAVPALFKLLDSEDDRDAARGALREIDDADATAVPILTEALKSEDRRRRFYAISLLRKVGPAAKEALPELQRIAEEDESRRTRDFVKSAIKSIQRESDKD